MRPAHTQFTRSIAMALASATMLMSTWVPGEAQGRPEQTLIVGTKESAPFAMKNPDGSWNGISIELWQSIAAALGVKYELREFDLEGLLKEVQEGSLDVAVAALTITADRERILDFTHPFYTTGLTAAVSLRGGGRHWLSVAERFIALPFLQVVVVLALVLFAVGVLVWVCERKRNPQQFGGGVASGIGAGFWWAAVTMTTVGYGDKAPVTLGGRLIAMLWMFTALIIIASFTAAITTALTVTELESPLRQPKDLVRVQVATVPGSTSETYLRTQHIAHRRYQTPLAGLEAVATGQIDAMVYDAPLLHYLAKTRLQGRIAVWPITFERQDYGIALPTGSSLREPINHILLEKIRRPEWQDILERYLGN